MYQQKGLRGQISKIILGYLVSLKKFRYVLEGAMVDSWRDLFHLLTGTDKRNTVRNIEISDRFLLQPPPRVKIL